MNSSTLLKSVYRFIAIYLLMLIVCGVCVGEVSFCNAVTLHLKNGLKITWGDYQSRIRKMV